MGDKKSKKSLKLSNTSSNRVRRLSISSQRRKEKLQKAKMQMAKAQSNFKIGKEQDLKDRKKGKKDKNKAYKRRTSEALKLAELRKIELSSAVSTALKQLKPAQRRKIEQEIKKQLQDEKNTIS